MCEMFGILLVNDFLFDYWLNEGDKISVGSLNFDICYLLGYVFGYIGFFDFENKIVFFGDVLFKDSIGRIDFYMGNFD